MIGEISLWAVKIKIIIVNKKEFILKYSFQQLRTPLTVLSLSCLLAACGGGGGDEYKYIGAPAPVTPDPVTPPVVVVPPVPAFDSDGVLTANIRWTDYGVPHITADNLESMSYGVGYAFAKDNTCMLADQILKYNFQFHLLIILKFHYLSWPQKLSLQMANHFQKV